MIEINENKLAKFVIQGSIMPVYGFGWEVCYDGVNRILPGVGGITLNFKVGDLANKFIADHLEPAVTTTMEPGLDGKNHSRKNHGYNTYSCIGNEAVIISGKAKGKKGVVTGHHGGCEHVMVDFDDNTLKKLTYDDKIMITSFGVGMEIKGYEEIKTFSLAPQLIKKMRIKPKKDKLEVPVAAIVPAMVMGSGLGSSDIYKGDYDIQTSDLATNKKFGLDKLKLGDIVAILDHDSTQGWSYQKGAVSIGVIIHGDSYLAGHGPGCQTILTSKYGKIIPKITANSNIGHYLKIGRYRKK